MNPSRALSSVGSINPAGGALGSPDPQDDAGEDSRERATGEDERPHRPVRSYVLRQGRISPAQQHALTTLWARFGVDYEPHALDFRRLFGRDAPVVLEIGCGMGETTAAIARAQPGIDFLGIEVHAPGVGSLLRQAAALELANLRIVQHDAVDVVAHMIPEGTLHRVHVFFPDPWPKKRHHKRRLLKPAFVHELAVRLAPGGVLHAATDWEDYAQEILAAFSAEQLLANTADDFVARPEWRPRTKFEARGLGLGHGVRDLLFSRR